MKRVIGIIVSVVLVLILASVLLFIIGGKDISPPDDNELRLAAVNVAEKENAYFDIMKAGEIIWWPKEEIKLQKLNEMLKGRDWDMGLAQEIIANNIETSEYIDKAVALNTYQIPELQNPKDFWLLSQIKIPMGTLKSLVSIDANFLSKLGAKEAAIKEAFKLIKLGHLLENSPHPCIISYLSGIALKKEGLKLLRELCSEADNLSFDICRHYMDQLDLYPADKETLKNALKIERYSLSNTIDKYIAGELTLSELGLGKDNFYNKFLFQPNKTKMEAIKNFQKLLLQTEGCRADGNFHPPSFWNYIIGNLNGKYYAWSLASSFNNMNLRVCIEDFSIRATKLFLALKAYKDDFGDLPKDLSELVPAYISEIPKDPFDNNPIRYSVEKKIIYSVGRDLKDVGGSTGEYLNEMEDPTIKINF